MMTRQQTALLIQRFVDGETSEHEEQQLAQYFATAETIPDEWREYKLMFDSFQTDDFDFTPTELDAFCQDSEDESANEQKQATIIRPSRHNGFRRIGIAAAVLALCGVGLCWHLISQEGETTGQSTAMKANNDSIHEVILADAKQPVADTSNKTGERANNSLSTAMPIRAGRRSKPTYQEKEDRISETSMLEPQSCEQDIADNTMAYIEATCGMPDFDAPYMVSEQQPQKPDMSMMAERLSVGVSSSEVFGIDDVTCPQPSAVSADYDMR